MRLYNFIVLTSVGPVVSQRIWDIWQTTWNRSNLFTSLKLPPISFGTPGPIGDADIVVDTRKYQQMDGFGASLTDSSALVLNDFKSSNSSGYWSLLYKLFDPTEAVSSAALSVVRVPIGASDFSASGYTFDDTWNDLSLSAFSVDRAPAYVWSTLADIKTVTPYLKFFIVPWTAPAWMKTSSSLNGGTLKSGYEKLFAQYLFKSVQGFTNKGYRPFAISCQNEPQHSNPTYPTMLLPVEQEALVGIALRELLDSNGYTDVKIIGFEHNWDNAATYPVQLMQQAPSAFAGASFHCYAGTASAQAAFTNAYPSKGVWFTECTGVINTDWWRNIKWNVQRLFVSSTTYGSRSVLIWNLVGRANGDPKLPGTGSCFPGCRPVVSVDNNRWYLNEEYYMLAHSSRIVIPREKGGGFATRIGVSVGGSLGSTLSVQAYVTPRASSSDWLKYGIVVLNANDASGGWNPQPVATTISFNGLQVSPRYGGMHRQIPLPTRQT
ncbi:hypothetical protein FRB91_000767 [Serendipita sp. 411]|nr:hypothetical protein FRB91_000767 [Serendipita sp. 411]